MQNIAVVCSNTFVVCIIPPFYFTTLYSTVWINCTVFYLSVNQLMDM